MNRLALLLTQLLLLMVCRGRADDVGLDYDPADQDAWEHNYGDYPYKSYQSSDLHTPAVASKMDSPQCHDGLYTFLTPRGKAVNTTRGMVIMDDKGEPVWMEHTTGQPYNLNVQQYKGEPHLTYWLGDDSVRGHGEGEYYMLNSSYHVVANISALNDLRADLHVLSITPNDTAIMSIYEKSQKDGIYIYDCLFQEIDLGSNTLVHEWRASDHHSLSESYHTRGRDGRTNASYWDWYHMNSVEKDFHGNYLVSARYTHSLSYVDGQNGDILWVLGGQRNMFSSDDGATDFSSQHYARFHSVDDFPQLLASMPDEEVKRNEEEGLTTQLITLFDNRRDDRWDTTKPSRGLLIQVTYPSVPGNNSELYTARILQEYNHPDDLSAESQGSVQILPSTDAGHDPTVVLGWGARPVWSVFTADGQMMCDTHFGTSNAQFESTVQSYRAMKYPWTGKPLDPPSVVLDSERNSIFVSWNGATEVQTWALQHSDSLDARDADWIYVSIIQKKAFETEIDIGNCVTRYLRVVALDLNDNVIGVSNEIPLEFQSNFSCDDMDNVPFAILDVRAFYVGGIKLTPIGVVMVTMCVTMFLVLAFESWRLVVTWRKRRDFHYYRLEVDPYLH